MDVSRVVVGGSTAACRVSCRERGCVWGAEAHAVRERVVHRGRSLLTSSKSSSRSSFSSNGCGDVAAGAPQGRGCGGDAGGRNLHRLGADQAGAGGLWLVCVLPVLLVGGVCRGGAGMRASIGRRPATAVQHWSTCTACIPACTATHESTHTACINVVVLLLLPSQLFPVEGSPLRKGMEDPAQWLTSLWEPEAHGSVASQFLMGVQVGLCCGQERRERCGIDLTWGPACEHACTHARTQAFLQTPVLHAHLHALVCAAAQRGHAPATTPQHCPRTVGAHVCDAGDQAAPAPGDVAGRAQVL